MIPNTTIHSFALAQNSLYLFNHSEILKERIGGGIEVEEKEQM